MYAGRMVEGGDSETVTQTPAHPYTRLLIDSAPDPDRLHGELLPGFIGSAAEPPQGALPGTRDQGNGEPQPHPPTGRPPVPPAVPDGDAAVHHRSAGAAGDR